MGQLDSNVQRPTAQETLPPARHRRAVPRYKLTHLKTQTLKPVFHFIGSKGLKPGGFKQMGQLNSSLQKPHCALLVLVPAHQHRAGARAS
jgi:hypothetical protein